jgi:hypothetical protein
LFGVAERVAKPPGQQCDKLIPVLPHAGLFKFHAVAPDLRSAVGFDELRLDHDPVVGMAHFALDEVSNRIRPSARIDGFPCSRDNARQERPGNAAGARTPS